MKVRAALLVLGSVMLSFAGTGCGSGDGAGSVPTPEELAAGLLRPADVAGSWSITVPDSDVDVPESGVVTDEMRDLLPGFELCPAASSEAQDAASNLEWNAFMQLELQADDPIDPPADRSGHMIFLQQYLAASTTADAAETFALLKSGSEACLGDFPADEEGPGRVDPMETPALGDERFGVLMTMQEAGGSAEWQLHNVVVRDGAVLMILVITDIRMGDGVEPYFTIDDIATIARTAAAKL